MQTTRWLRLDNAAKIYPAARRRNWSNVYRQSVTLKDKVDIAVLKSALDVIVPRFPSIAAKLRKGAFWYYLRPVDKAPEISCEYSYPLAFMSKKEIRRCAFRVIAYDKRIAVEYFHSLTDGTGALVFLKTLAAEYLEQKYGISVPSGDGILDRTIAPRDEELEDSFLKYAGPVRAGRSGKKSWRIKGETIPGGVKKLTCFKISVNKALELAHSYKCTLTVFMSAVMVKALLNLQKEKVPSVMKRQPIKLLIPINLRKLFPSETLRNFAMYTIPEIDARLGEYTLDELCRIIEHKMGEENTAKFMSTVIASNVGDEKNALLRLVPLPVKNIVMKLIFEAMGEKRSCLNLSNLGLVKVPECMGEYVERFDFILDVPATTPYNCGMLSYKDTIYINFLRNIKEPSLERHFFEVLRELSLEVTVESNN